MIEEIKVGGVWFWLCIPIIGILQSLSVPMRLIQHALEEILLLDCRGKINPLVRAKCPIIRF
ncbi:hypothetical protein HMPREF1408_01383 [Helicobacter pylori GAM245Ai]|nr:hypothetical protein HMPREF1400_00728 [Helicobacter pylori GAM119Bi]EMH04183.1 hypothetical protein HMPREF1408_01383 [Helicobacter pylori GAM245Ai]